MTNYIIAILLAIYAIPAMGQSISIFDIDTTNFPTMKAKFYAFDKDGKANTPSISDLKLSENGTYRKITNIKCPIPKPPQALSSVLVIDISGSMVNAKKGVSNMDIAKAAANVWVNTIDLNQSECAITSFDNSNYLNQDFTSDRNLLLNSIAPLTPSAGTNYDAALFLANAGGLQISKNGKHKKVIVLITDGVGNVSENQIISEAQRQNCVIYCVTINMTTPYSLRNIALKTGGQYFENVKSKEDAESVYTKILQIAQGIEPCELEWESNYNCSLTDINLEVEYKGRKDNFIYVPSVNSITTLIISPFIVQFGGKEPNKNFDTTVTIKALNTDFTINDITLKYGTNNFLIINATFPILIPKNTSKDITLRFTPNDSSTQYAAFDIQTDKCDTYLSTSGGFPGNFIKYPTLRVTIPNGGEEFVVGSDTVITWKGVSPKDTVSLDYSLDSGKTWNFITDNATGLSFKWKNLPKTTSKKCLVRVQQKGGVLKPYIEWTQNYGGRNIDRGNSVLQTREGGYIFIGHNTASQSIDPNSSPNSGDIKNCKGASDCWVVKSDNKGNLEWEVSIGGKEWEGGYSIIESHDNGYILAMVGSSIDGDLDKNKGANDIWIIKLSIDGKIEWKKNYGGSRYDSPSSIIKTDDNCYLVCGVSYSFDGDIKKNNGNSDGIFFKIDIGGNLIWMNNYGGANVENISSVIKTNDGGYLFSIYSTSKDNGYNSKWVGGEAWIVKTDVNGKEEWKKYYGGNGSDQIRKVINTNDSCYVFVVATNSIDGDITIPNGNYDYWVVKIDTQGNIIWQKSFGGKNEDYVQNIINTNDGGFIITGRSFRFEKNITGSYDIWIIKINKYGEMEWNSVFGGKYDDEGMETIQTIDGGYLVFGFSGSNDGDVKNSKGDIDYFAVKLSPDKAVIQQDISDTLFSIVAPAPASKDIDMKKCVVNFSKDSVINDFIINQDKYQFGVDSIYFTGADAGAFYLVSGLPKYDVLGNSNEYGEVRFTPNRVGVHSAKLNIITTYDTLVQNIIGEGVASGIEVVNNIIDFGNVSLGKFRDSIQAATIKNISKTDILITNIKQAGPNYSDFSILSNVNNILLKAGDTIRLDLKYTPSFDGKVNGSLSFEFNEIGSPAYLQLYGRGIDAKAILSADSSSAYMRKEAKVTLSLTNMDKLIDVGNTHISVELVYNKTMLYPKTILNRIVEGDSVVLKLDSLPLVTNPKNELAILKFTATLGNAEETSLSLRNVKIIGADANITVVNGKFKLLGVCYEGGERFLVGNKSKTMLLSIAPNPATESIEIEYSNADEGEAEIIISNLLGQTILTQKLEKTQTGIAKLDLSQLPTGQYSILFKTETVLENRIIQVIK